MEELHGEDQQSFGHYRPCVQEGESEHGGFEVTVRSVDLMSVDQCDAIREMDDSQLVGASEAGLAAKGGSSVAEVEKMMMMMKNKVEAKAVQTTVGKRRRGRPPRDPAMKTKTKTAPRKRKDEEDVCFICFDGGSLVLCDRRGCPKAYHPACIKRDESFFKSRAKWNCGWHICSSCQKAAHYMCYTCTYSLCKGCVKDADYVNVRGNNGLCGTCMRTVMLIENVQENKEMAQVDFDDKSSWEYLFKVYWMFLKGKVSLTLDELTRAKNPWKGTDTIACKRDSSGELHNKGNDDKGSSFQMYCAGVEKNNSNKRKAKKQPILSKKDSLTMEISDIVKDLHPLEGTRWASKELLEFVAHMRNGDTSALSEYNVQALLQEYIKKNNLRDPHQKCQIVCDSRLINLFGKTRVGHFEMLKLLESHFLIKDASLAEDIFRVGVVDAIASQVEADGDYGNQLPKGSDKRRKTRKKVGERGSPINLDAFAAIDVHNINLIYLRRNLMESLMDDADKLHEKVVGSIVRIRILNNDQKQEMYRLVQVVGTSKVAEPYKLGERSTDVMLEILNLDKKEAIAIDEISNQEFSEDECKRLCQSIKCGLIKRLTVGDVQATAMTLQAVRVNNGLEAEILRLNHLRDRASEKGHKKELRECVEKLELLNSLEERQRRLSEITEVHTDPKMDPSFKSKDNAGELDEKKRDDNLGTKLPGRGRKRREPIPAQKGVCVVDNSGSRAKKNFPKSSEKNRKFVMTSTPDKGGAIQLHERINESSLNQERESSGICWNTPVNLVHASGSLAVGWNSQEVVSSEMFGGVAPEGSQLALSIRTEESANTLETDKLWHYQDPNGKVQGPFSMLQLRKWNTTGHFPSDLRIWKINEKQNKSVLLTDALNGRYPGAAPLPDNGNSESQGVEVASGDRLLTDALNGGYHEAAPLPDSSNLLSQGVEVASDNTDNNCDDAGGGDMNALQIDNKGIQGTWKPKQDDSRDQGHGNVDILRSDGWGFHSSSWSTPAGIVNSNEGRNGAFKPGWDSSKGNSSWPEQPQVCSSSLTPPAFSGKPDESLPHQAREGHGVESNSDRENGNCSSRITVDCQTKNEEGYDNRSDGEGHSGQSSGQSWRPPPINCSSNSWVSNSGLISVVKSLETADQTRQIDFPDLPSPTLKQSNEESKVRAAENNQTASSSVPVQDAGPTWSTASSLVGCGPQISEVAGELGGYSPPAKPSVEEWDSSLVSASSLKPTEMASDHAATPTSITDQLTHSSPSHPASNASSWPAIVTEPTEFCSLADESVSDLLAEVEAMESLDGLPSPTSIMKCGEALTGDSKNGCISPLDGFSPGLDPGKSDALSSTATGDLQLRSQSMVTTDERISLCRTDFLDPTKRSSGNSSQSTVTTDERISLCHTDFLDPPKRSSGNSSTSVEVEGDARTSDISVNQWETGSDIQPTPPSTESWNMAGADTSRRVGSESTSTSWGAVQGSANLGLGGLDQRNTNMGWGAGQVATQDSISINLSASAGNPGIWGTQPRYGGDRFSGPRDRGFQGRDLGYGRGRGMWNRQPIFIGGNGGGSFRSPPKGQRVCKFYESGYCKKGASCDYWHP